MLTKLLLRAAVLVCAVFLSACTTLTKAPSCHDFDGIKTALDQECTVTVLIVHGMSGYSEGNPDNLVRGITKELGLCCEGAPYDRHITAEAPCKWYGCLSRQDYCGVCCPYRLRVYVLDWRPATWNEKSILRDIDESCCDTCRRLPFLDKLKRDFINSGLGDVTLYLGAYGDEIRYPFEQAIRWIAMDSEDDPCHPIIVVSFSMGGQMLLDTLENMQSPSDATDGDAFAAKVRQAFIERTCAFFMLSNQIPLLELANLQPARKSYRYHDDACPDECLDCCPTAPLKEPAQPQHIDWSATSLGHFVNERRETLPDFRIVSISDPNDLISYSFHGCGDYCCDSTSSCEGYFLNAPVLNVKTAYFGLINPSTAHQGYGQNRCVIKMIVYGSKG